MRAYLRVFSLFALITSCVFGEEKGGYIGIDVGSSYTEFTQDVQPIGKILASNNLPGFMLKAGYKTFFGESKKYGMRWYLYGGYSYGKMQDVKADAFRRMFGVQQPQIDTNSIFIGTGKGYYTHVVDYGVGTDFLRNFVVNDDHSFGVFVGVGVGAETWIANGKEYKPSGQESLFNFQTIINLGFRGVVKQSHGVEFGVKFHILDAEIFKGSGPSPLFSKFNNMQQQLQQYATSMTTTTTMRRLHSFYMSYVYNF